MYTAQFYSKIQGKHKRAWCTIQGCSGHYDSHDWQPGCPAAWLAGWLVGRGMAIASSRRCAGGSPRAGRDQKTTRGGGRPFASGLECGKVRFQFQSPAKDTRGLQKKTYAEVANCVFIDWTDRVKSINSLVQRLSTSSGEGSAHVTSKCAVS